MCGAVRSGSILRKKRPAKRTFAPPGRKKTGRKPVTFLQRNCFRRPACGILRVRAYKIASMRRCGFVSFCRRNPYPARGRKLFSNDKAIMGFARRNPYPARGRKRFQSLGILGVMLDLGRNPYPQGDGNSTAKRNHPFQEGDAIPTPQGDGNLLRLLRCSGSGETQSLPRKGTETLTSLHPSVTAETQSLPRKGTETTICIVKEPPTSRRNPYPARGRKRLP